MKTDDFIYLNPPIPEKDIFACYTVDELAKIMSKSDSMENLSMTVRDGVVRGHEGRHRSAAAKMIGVEWLPVSIDVWEKGYYTYTIEEPEISYEKRDLEKMNIIEGSKGVDFYLNVAKYQECCLNMPSHFHRSNSHANRTSNNSHSKYAVARLTPDPRIDEERAKINVLFNIADFERFLK